MPSTLPPVGHGTRRDALLWRHDTWLRSAFQPIYSFSHRRLVGYEALLRASDAGGDPIAPPAVFERCRSLAERHRLDRLCSLLHARSFARQCREPQWLFLNVDASALAFQPTRLDPAAAMARMAERAGLAPHRIVVELLETALPDGSEAERWVAALKQRGFLVALDDFGAGHSNFDRVFRMRPYIVKLDRSVIARAAVDRLVRRVMAQMISLLHECGAMVLVEGVETAAEAEIALDADADLVQGYRFGRPQRELEAPDGLHAAMDDVWQRCDARSRHDLHNYLEQVQPYAEAIGAARERLLAGEAMEAACAAFLRLGQADLCFLLDADGVQIGGPALYRTPPDAADARRAGSARFEPLHDVRGARWSRRPYFRRAVAAPGRLQVTRPYPTMHSNRMSVTLSVCFELRSATVVLCGDMIWQAGNDRPGFGSTTYDAVS